MKINTKSWHYRFMGYREWNEPNNLCKYFWKLVGKIFGYSLFGGIALFIIGLYTYMIATASKYYLIQIGIVIAWAFGSFFSSWYAIVYLRMFIGKSPEMPYGNIFMEYLKAQKDKICPFIEYE